MDLFSGLGYALYAYGGLPLHCLGKGAATERSKNRIAYFWNTVESVVKVHWILQMGEMNPNKIDV